MPSTVFLSAASIDLRKWRDVLDAAFRGVLTQDHSLSSAPGNVKRLLTETIAASDCIIYLAGMGYGSRTLPAGCPVIFPPVKSIGPRSHYLYKNALTTSSRFIIGLTDDS